MGPAHPGDLAKWARGLEITRAVRDAEFRQGTASPVAPDKRPRFRGLDFYPPDAHLRYRLPLQPSPKEAIVEMEVSRGRPRRFRRVGYFDILLDDVTARLWAFREVGTEHDGALFVPFRDATSGTETYGAGRYLDLPEREDGEYDLDFNDCYNPLCAVSDAYSCPRPPPENWLAVPIRAGEKRPLGLDER